MPTPANPLSGHTEANTTNTVDGLRDGDHILSPSFTNQYEGIHGNGIILQEDGNASHSDRNAPESLPGAVSRLNGTTVQIKGGHCVLDGVVYEFANGPDNTLDIEFDDGTPSPFDRTGGTGGGGRQLMSGAGEEVLYTVYVCADDGGGSSTKNVCYMQGTVITTATAAYADSPDLYLRNPHGAALTNLQSCVLAVVRATSTGGSGPDRIDILEVNDKRHFLNGGPFYMHPMKLESSGNPVDSAANLDLLHGGPREIGSLNTAACDFGALWLSHEASNAQNLYLSARDATPTRHTWRLGPDKVKVWAPTTDHITFTFDSYNMFIITTDNARTINPTGTFPPGHTVEIYHLAGGHTLTFNTSGGGTPISQNVAITYYAKFVFDGTNWHKLDLHVVA